MSDILSYTDHFNEAFQRHFLAVVSREPGALARFRSAVSHEYFTSDVSRAVALGLITYYDKNLHLPTQATLTQEAADVAAKTQRGAVEPFVRKLFADDISDATGVLTKAVEFGKHAALVNAVLKAADKAEASRLSIVERGRACKAIIEEAMMVGEDVNTLGLDYTKDVALRARKYLSPDPTDEPIPTGLRHLDRAIGGGLPRGALGMIVAPPGRGKSTFLCNVGFNNLITTTKRVVVHISMEMSAEDIVRKYDDRIVHGVSHIKNTRPDELEERLTSRIRKYIRGTLLVKRYFTRSVGASTFRGYLNVLAANGYKPDVVLIDYADIVKAERRMGVDRHEQASIYEDLRTLAGEFDCAVWTASQTNRGGAGKDLIELTDIAESFEKAAIVDVGLLFSQSRDENVRNSCRIHVEKVRNHEDHTIVECEIRRDRSMMRSIGHYDAQYNPMDDDSAPNTAGKTAFERHMNQGASERQAPRRNFQANGPSRRVGGR